MIVRKSKHMENLADISLQVKCITVTLKVAIEACYDGDEFIKLLY